MLTAEQILALAPDPASAKAGSSQANPSYWSGLGSEASALWGLCQGSGKEPYRTQIELSSPSFKCSCPSRKFPCKHGLGLYLLYAKQRDSFTNTMPDWVRDWLQGRDERSEKKAAKEIAKAVGDAALTQEQLVANEKGARKRQDKRDSNVAQGIALLDTWLADLAREGLAGLRSKPASAWEAMAARMVDAQAAGLASRIRHAGLLIYGTTSSLWEVQVARELGYLALLSRCMQQLDKFSPALQADIRSAVGWVATQEEALATPPQNDLWHVLGNDTRHDERISRRACYLRGQHSGRFAMLLQFSAGGQHLPPPLIPNTYYRGSLHFYPSTIPLRVVFGPDMELTELPVHSTSTPPLSIPRQLQHYAEHLALNPIFEQGPMILHDVIPQLQNPEAPTWSLLYSDDNSDNGKMLALDKRFTQGWLLHALAGGAKCTVFGLWNGVCLLPLALLPSVAHRGVDSGHGQIQLHSFDAELS